MFRPAGVATRKYISCCCCGGGAASSICRGADGMGRCTAAAPAATVPPGSQNRRHTWSPPRFAKPWHSPPTLNDAVHVLSRDCAAGKGVILACEIGGTLIPSTNFQTGKVSRSLKAAYAMLAAGYPLDKVPCLLMPLLLPACLNSFTQKRTRTTALQ